MCPVLLWDGKISDVRGGAHHMLQQVQSHGGQVEILDTSKLEYWYEKSGLIPLADRR